MKVDSPIRLCSIPWDLLAAGTLILYDEFFLTTTWETSLPLGEYCGLENSLYSIFLQIESFEMVHETSNPSKVF